MRDEKLDFWLKHNFNVCFVGRHGVGKTAMVKACFERAGLVHGDTYLYFSGATLDPWVDFVGVPKERVMDKIPEQFQILKELATIDFDLALEWVASNWKLTGDKATKVVNHALGRKEGCTFLDLVRPEAFARDSVVAVFLDEFNRSPKKVRNAAMELLQFKSINGKKFPNLRVVWTAVNPDEDDEYDVEKIDPAQMDRFQISVVVPYKPNENWFVSRFGDRVGRAAIQWWTDLSADEQKNVSPRRLEYALTMWEAKGDMRDVLPQSSNVMKLMQSLNTGPISERIEELYKARDTAAAKLFLSNENNFQPAMKVICESEGMMEFFLPLLTKEKISFLLSSHERACRYIMSSFGQHTIFQTVMQDVLNVNQNKPLVKKIRRALTDNTVAASGFGPSSSKDKPAPPHYVRTPPAGNWSEKLAKFKLMPVATTANRTKLYNEIIISVPEKMTGDEALTLLEVMDSLLSQAWETTLTADGENSLKLALNVINHAIAQLALAKNMNWSEIVAMYGPKIRHLLDKIKAANLANQLFTPTK